MASFPSIVARQLERARLLHPKPMNSLHEGLGVLREEYVEVEQEIFRKEVNPMLILSELVDLAVVCQRLAEDVIAGMEGGHS